ncbi:hypothetical protein A4A49_01022 [Nicotiana attenuata]|uniref:Uncharacterized protein n=1 Tax=Nicotiana attenuata TaxID=49451 RepID=A0A314LG46_NICAT|nr:hypothetical protein A4A49_01022 [Nicotiana attenuata]
MHLATAGAMQADADRAKNSMVPSDQNFVGQDTIGVGALGSTTATSAKTAGDRDAAGLEATVALNETGDRPTVGAPKYAAALVDLVEKQVGDVQKQNDRTGQQQRTGTSQHNNANRKGQELDKGDGVAGILGKRDASNVGGTSANKNATDMLEAGSQHGQQSLAKGWYVVHRSPSKKASSDHKNLEAAAEFKCSNSFDALACAHEHGEKDLQHKEIDRRLNG